MKNLVGIGFLGAAAYAALSGKSSQKTRQNPTEIGDEIFDSAMDVREIQKILKKQKIPYQSLKFDNIYTDSMYGQIENVFFLKKSGGMTADEQKRLRPELVRYFKQVYNTFASLEFEKSGSGVFIVASFGKKKPSASKNPSERVQSHFKQVAIATFGVPPEHQDKVSVMFTTQGMTVSFNRIICDDFTNENLNRFMEDYSQYLENNFDGKWETSSTMRGNIVTINFIRAE